MIEIKLDSGNQFLPEEVVSGRVTWSLNEAPKEATVHLLWHTAGKGSEDIYIVDEVSFNTAARSGEYIFKFQLPAEPYSFSGHLISLCWLVEVVTKKPDESAKQEIIISPTRKEILLGEV